MRSAPLLLLLLSPTSAYAYLDPGTGSLLLQSLIGAVAMGFGAVSFYWGRIKAKIKGLRKKKEQQEEEAR